MVNRAHIGAIKHERDCPLHGSLAAQRNNPLSCCGAIAPSRVLPYRAMLDVDECDAFALRVISSTRQQLIMFNISGQLE